MSTIIDIDSLYKNSSLKFTLTRAKLEDLCKDEFEKCLKFVCNVLNDADIDKSEVDDIVLVGGSTRIPYINNMLKKFLKEINYVDQLIQMKQLHMELQFKQPFYLV